MKSNIKEIIFCTLVIIMLVWLIVSQIKCNSLQKQLNQEKIKNLEQVDSLIYINRQHENTINNCLLEIDDLKTKVDSLNGIKQQIIVHKDGVIVSKDVSSAVDQLKINLAKWEN